jgi:hypothetical protein
MAAPFPTTYYIGIGTAISNLGVLTELSGGSYARLACAFTGTALSGLTQTVGPWVVATAPTPAVTSAYGGIFDALTGGDLLAYWSWTAPYTGSLTAFPQTVINIQFNVQISSALNLALIGGQGSSGSLIDLGAQIGTVNGQPLLTAIRMGIGPGGTLVPHFGQGQWVGSADVQGTLNFGSLATNSVNNGITALAGGANTSLTPTLSGFYNRATTVVTANDSSILPPFSAAPTGSIIAATNSGAAAMKIFTDAGAVVNAGLTSLTMGVGTSCFFVRATPTQWITVPGTPS